MVYVPGLTDRTGSKERAGISAEADAAGYNKRQTQRYMERTVRKWKRRQAAAITPEDERMARAYVVKWQGKLRELTGGTTLPRKYDREGGRVKLSDAAKKLKAFTFSPNGSIINPNNPSTITIAGKTFSMNFRTQKQQQHILGTKDFNERTEREKAKNGLLPSAFYQDVDIEELVRRYMGKGNIKISKTNVVSEYFSADREIGIVPQEDSGAYIPTTRVCIRYSKIGWHAFPVKEVR